MAHVREILAKKGHEIHSLTPDAMVLDALQLMADRNIGSVPIVEGGRLVGIFTERHYARNVFLKGRASPETPLREVMQTELMTVTPDQTAEACMALMTDKAIRHLPVMEEEAFVGIISIGDLMKSILDDRQYDIDQLVDYVRG